MGRHNLRGPAVESRFEALEPRLLLSSWSGDLPDGTVWGDTPGEVEVISSDVTLPEGATLTIQPGAVVKFGAGTRFTIDGTVNAPGTAGGPIVLTSIKDDTVGGDTNGDGGLTSPAPGDWKGLALAYGDTAQLDATHVDIRYGGGSSTPGIRVYSGQLSLANVTLRDLAQTGIYVSSGSGGHTLTDVSVTDVGGAGVYVSSSGATMTTANLSVHNVGTTALIAADAGKWNSTNTTLTGTGVRALRLEGGTIADARAWDDDFIYYLSGIVTVSEGAELTIPAGRIIKADGEARLVVDGVLNVNGTPGAPVAFTSIHDDAVGGDTNANGGSTVPAPGDWQAFTLASGHTAQLSATHADIRYAGDGSTPGIRVYSGRLSLANVTFSDLAQTGIYVSGGWGQHTLTDVSVTDVGGAGVYVSSTSATMTTDNLSVHNVGTNALVAVDAGRWNSTNTALSGTGVRALRLDGGTITDTRAWDDDLVYFLSGTVLVDAGGSLTIPAGKVVKADADGMLQVEGTLNVPGTSGAPVVFTSIRDDTAGGDTNGNADASVPAAGNWKRIWVRSGGTGDLQHVDIRYGGKGSGSIDSSISNSGGHLTLSNSTVSDGLGDGVWTYSGTATLTGNTISNVGEYGIRVDTNSAVTMTGNAIQNADRGPVRIKASTPLTASGTTSTGSGKADAIYVQSGNISGARQWQEQLPYWVEGRITIGTDGELTLPAGGIFKMGSAAVFEVHGTLTAVGGPGQEIVFTSLADDTHGGDTNGDGPAAVPAPGDWDRIWVRTGGVAEVRHVRLLYGGKLSNDNPDSSISTSGGTLTLTDSTIDQGFGEGVWVNSGHATVTNNVITNVAKYGLRVQEMNNALDLSGNQITNAASGALIMKAASRIDLAGTTWSGCGRDDAVYVESGSSVPGARVWPGGRTYLLDSGLTVAGSGHLTIGPGAVLKFRSDKGFVIDGAVSAVGTEAEPIIFTSWRDDTGGDSNADGAATTPAPGDWRHIWQRNTASADSVFRHVEVRHAGVEGVSGTAAVLVYGGTMEFTDSLIADGFDRGFRTYGSKAEATLRDVIIRNVQQEGIRVESSSTLRADGVTLENVSGPAISLHPSARPTFADVNVVNCDRPFTQIYAGGTIRSDWTIGHLGTAVFDGSSVTVDPAGSLTILPGTNVKAGSRFRLEANGPLIADGTVQEPILFTSVNDDEAGGDTNGDGFGSDPAPGDWGYLSINNSASRLSHAEFRYGGTTDGGYRNTSLRVTSGAVVNLSGLLVHQSAAHGVWIEGGSDVTVSNSIIADNANYGVYSSSWTDRVRLINNTIYGGQAGVYLRNRDATLANNIITGASDAGVVATDSSMDMTARFNNVYNPGAANGNYHHTSLPGWVPGDLSGEISTDPLFADLAGGVFELGEGSPAIDAASEPDAPLTDFYDRPRFDDRTVENTGAGFIGYVDMGALERFHSGSGVDLVPTAVAAELLGDGTIRFDVTIANVGSQDS
ncbi:MAG: right-handed parallel beta-helix repeat-containing protein, partial [Planctomycetota bacterium]